MTLFGVVGKDVLGRMRTWRAALVVGLHLVMLTAIALGQIYATQVSASGAYGGAAGPAQGPELFNTLASFELLLIAFLTPALTAAAISGERERRTFELLLLTRLSGIGIVAGKLISTVCFLVVLIVGSLPVFSLVFVFGGVAPQTLLRIYLLYATAAGALATGGICASALSKRTQTSIALSYAFAFLLVFGTTIAAAVLNAPTRPLTGGPPEMPTLAWIAAAANPLDALLSVLPNPGGTGVAPYVTMLPAPGFLTGAEQPPLAGIWHAPLWRLNVEMEGVLALVFVLLAACAVRPPRPRWPRSGDRAA